MISSQQCAELKLTLLNGRADGSLFLFTPFDPLFLLLALLSGLPHRFETYSDLWEAVAHRSFLSTDASSGETGEGEGAEDIKRLGALACVRKRVEAVCDVQGTFFFCAEQDNEHES